MSFLLDTCVLSEFAKRVPSPVVSRWLDEQEERGLFITTVSIGEMEKGIAALRDAGRQRKMRTFLENAIVDRFRERILETTGVVWRRWGALSGAAQRVGKTLPAIDGILAAVALTHGLTVATRNEADFKRCGVSLVNPWSI
ncbi:MAG: type II toxin-antitoxin system VapC family toxin [Archangium sp.]|nr:type II toxin-antitoxin system VapC family toxin [Archangium sp.]